MKKRSKILLTAVLSMSMLLTACGGGKQAAPTQDAAKKPAVGASKTADSLKLTLAGGSAGGFWSLIGEGVGNIFRQAIPNI